MTYLNVSNNQNADNRCSNFNIQAPQNVPLTDNRRQFRMIGMKKKQFFNDPDFDLPD